GTQYQTICCWHHAQTTWSEDMTAGACGCCQRSYTASASCSTMVLSFASGHRQQDPTTIPPWAINRRIRRTRSNSLPSARRNDRRREGCACRMFFDALGGYIIREVASGLKDVPIKSRRYSVP